MAPGAVTVFKREELRDLGARTLEDALRLVPGVDITRDSLGRPQISMRGIGSGSSGGASENVAVLVNGLSIGDHVLGGFGAVNLQISLDHVKQLEVLRNPGSSLYGSGAVAGVVDIVTLEAEDQDGVSVLVGLGSHQTQDYVLQSGGAGGKLRLSGFIRFFDTAGEQPAIPVDVQTGTDALSRSAGFAPISVAPGRARDGQRSFETNYRVRYADFFFGLRARQEKSGGFVGYGGRLGRQNDVATRQLSVDVGWQRPVKPLGRVTVRAFYSRDDNRSLFELFPAGYTIRFPDGSETRYGQPGQQGGVLFQTALNGSRFGLEGRLERDFGSKHRLVVGASLGGEATDGLAADSNVDYRYNLPLPVPEGKALVPLAAVLSEASRSVMALQANDTWQFRPGSEVTAGVRLDHVYGMGARLSPRLVFVSRLPEAWTRWLPPSVGPGLSFRASWTTGFRAPTFSELYFELPGLTGNESLEPITSNMLDFALGLKSQRVNGSIGFFHGTTSRSIEARQPFDVLGFQPIVNGEGSSTSGLETAVRVGLSDDDSVFGTWTWQSVQLRDSGLAVPGIPGHMLNLGATFRLRTRYVMTPTLVVRGSRPRAHLDTRSEVPGFAQVDLVVRAERVYRALDLSLILRNVFDCEGAAILHRLVVFRATIPDRAATVCSRRRTGSERDPMRFFRGPGVILGVAAILLGLPAVGRPAEMPVPAETQIPLLLKILTYDRNLTAKAGTDLVVGVVFDSSNRSSAAAADKVGTALYAMKGRTVKGRPLTWFAVEYTGAADLEKAVRSKGIGVFYLTPGNDAHVSDIIALCPQTRRHVHDRSSRLRAPGDFHRGGLLTGPPADPHQSFLGACREERPGCEPAPHRDHRWGEVDCREHQTLSRQSLHKAQADAHRHVDERRCPPPRHHRLRRLRRLDLQAEDRPRPRRRR